MATSPEQKGTTSSRVCCTGSITCLLISISTVFAIVGLVAPWGAASLHASVLSGQGTFTLWQVTIASSVVGFKLPQSTISIEDGLCGGSGAISWTAEGHEVCDTFGKMRVLTILSVLTCLLGLGCSIAKCLKECRGDDRHMKPLGLAAATALLAALTVVFAAAALAEAASLSQESPQIDGLAQKPGAGSICMGLLVLSALAVLVLESRAACRLRQASRDVEPKANTVASGEVAV